MKKVKFLCIATALALLTTSAQAQICPATIVKADGIGDGCTTLFIGYVLPEIGIFKSTFTPSCDRHDKCYATIGNGGRQCDDSFRSDMLAACKSSFNPIFRPAEYFACTDSALKYYEGVRIWEVSTNPILKIQRDHSLPASRALETSVSVLESCGTTPERTTIYSQALINKINNIFLTYRYRKPSIYEFLAAVNNTNISSNVVTDPVGWESRVIAQVNSSAIPFSLPSVDFTNTLPVGGGQISVINPNASYRWTTNFGSDQFGSIFTIAPVYPMWDLNYPLQGILKAKAGSIRNLAVIDTNVYEQGWCGPVAGPNVHCN